MPPQTQSKTVLITNTRLVMATLALVGAAALAFVAIPSLPEGYVCVVSDNGIEIQKGDNNAYTANNYCINERTIAKFVCNGDADNEGEVFHSVPTQCDRDQLCLGRTCVLQDYGRSCVMSEDRTMAKICLDETCGSVIQTLSDHCVDSNTLGKVSCDGGGLVQVTKVDCENGCVLHGDGVGSCSQSS